MVFKENEMAILRTEKPMMRAMCGVKMIEKKESRAYEFAGFKGLWMD